MTTYSFGPTPCDNGFEFRLWAPRQETILLDVEGRPPQPMERDEKGWHFAHAPCPAGTRYAFLLPDGTRVPDPASRHQPEDVHGPSEIVHTRAFSWMTPDWRGRAWEETILYELHVGTFTPDGTFAAAIERLDHLAALGITAIQIMPVADFPGRRNWGYDGVLPYAPDSRYGRPEDMMAFIDAAHSRGISVFLDVVYNHFGPDGNYLPLMAPIFTDSHHTPWGNAVNLDGEGARDARDFLIENALYWIVDYRLDGLRFDAVHALIDDSEEHLLHEMARRIRAAAGDRHVHLIVENEENDARLLDRNGDGKAETYTAQWNDDIHHVLHVAATGETTGYYADYEGEEKLIRALVDGFVFQGETMPYRGTPRGEPSGELPPTAFVSFIQNHDQVGNRAYGDRIGEIAKPEALRAIAALYLLAPQIPMLFMGEEWNAKTPFPYFCDFNEELNTAVREGRAKELARLPGFQDHDGEPPVPTVPETFEAAKLDWEERLSGDHADHLSLYKRLIALRRSTVIPRLPGITGKAEGERLAGKVIRVTWRLGDGSRLTVTANLDDVDGVPIAAPAGRSLWIEGAVGASGEIGAWTVIWTLEQP
ncbi:maltooligosyl trehalose hydrolase [Rhizobium sp. RU20A]|uniref:malto-oligosyltrehalose trehalohydrolase n=1 Tax=Rhizobium sp. RU20A TaxID=1907412 RepID=UPI0009567136|nr:malto-oligosyltrehalose trehalohydrolase [Rhizobium sp. RU20A]SIQ96885.1 maltooligosyl trehalose hydrolase [Rhizobium sp. RU20A]